MITISKTYEIVTPESAEQGDFAETGFEFERESFKFRDLIDQIKDFSEFSHSGTGFNEHTYVSQYCGITDYSTYEETTYNYHFADALGKAKYWIKALRYVAAKRR